MRPPLSGRSCRRRVGPGRPGRGTPGRARAMPRRRSAQARSGPMLRSTWGGPVMATFILLSSLTDEGAQTIREEPERIRAVNQELDRMGVHVVSQWAVLGPYDFVNVVEAEDNLCI